MHVLKYYHKHVTEGGPTVGTPLAFVMTEPSDHPFLFPYYLHCPLSHQILQLFVATSAALPAEDIR